MEFPRGKEWPAHRADKSAVLIVPIVKVTVAAQHSFSLLSLHDLLRESKKRGGGAIHKVFGDHSL